jgi:hypothetical protein
MQYAESYSITYTKYGCIIVTRCQDAHTRTYRLHGSYPGYCVGRAGPSK